MHTQCSVIHATFRLMVDTKQTKTIGEHYAAAELARRGWAPAFTRDGLERTDILAVLTVGDQRRLIEVQVKTTRHPLGSKFSWPLGLKAQGPSQHEREYFVLVAVPTDDASPPRYFIVPRAHLAAAAWIVHMDWLTDPGVPAGQRSAGVDRSRITVEIFAHYEDRWDLLLVDESAAPVLLPPRLRELALDARVGLPYGHGWHEVLPEWT